MWRAFKWVRSERLDNARSRLFCFAEIKQRTEAAELSLKLFIPSDNRHIHDFLLSTDPQLGMLGRVEKHEFPSGCYDCIWGGVDY